MIVIIILYVYIQQLAIGVQTLAVSKYFCRYRNILTID